MISIPKSTLGADVISALQAATSVKAYIKGSAFSITEGSTKPSFTDAPLGVRYRAPYFTYGDDGRKNGLTFVDFWSIPTPGIPPFIGNKDFDEYTEIMTYPALSGKKCDVTVGENSLGFDGPNFTCYDTMGRWNASVYPDVSSIEGQLSIALQNSAKYLMFAGETDPALGMARAIQLATTPGAYYSVVLVIDGTEYNVSGAYQDLDFSASGTLLFSVTELLKVQANINKVHEDIGADPWSEQPDTNA